MNLMNEFQIVDGLSLQRAYDRVSEQLNATNRQKKELRDKAKPYLQLMKVYKEMLLLQKKQRESADSAESNSFYREYEKKKEILRKNNITVNDMKTLVERYEKERKKINAVRRDLFKKEKYLKEIEKKLVPEEKERKPGGGRSRTK